MPRTRTRLPNGMGSIRRRETVRKDGSVNEYWEGRVTIGIDPVTGKHKNVYVTGKKQKEVMDRMQEILAELREGEYKKPSDGTLGDWLEIWLKEYQGSNKPMTIHNYTCMVHKHMIPALGMVPLKELDNLTIQKFYNSLGQNGRKLSPKTIKNIHGILHKALSQAVLAGQLKSNPADNSVLPRITSAEITPMEPEEITRFLCNLEGEPYKNLFIMAFFTGMRQGELLGLSWDEIDFEHGIVEIRQQLQCVDGEYFLQTPKNGKNRMIAPVKIVMDALREELEKQKENKALFGRAYKNKWNLVFTNEKGKYLVRRTVYKHYNAILEKSGITHHRFHDMRHTFAVSMLDAGEDLKSLQENLGHATAAFTLSQYAHVSQKMRLQSSKRMNEYFQKLMPEEKE